MPSTTTTTFRSFRPTVVALAVTLCVASSASAQQASSLQQVVVRGDAERSFNSLATSRSAASWWKTAAITA